MDAVYNYNRERWEALVAAGALFTRPWLDLDQTTARERLDRWGVLGDLAGKEVLCLAGGGGQQSVAFALLGARVTVFDISDGQLERDREAAGHYGVAVTTQQGDMRDLSALKDAVFDVVYQPYGLGFVPDCRVVFKEVARVLRGGGLYHFAIANPFASGMGTRDWTGEGYLVRRQYVEGAEITYADEAWVFREAAEDRQGIAGPREYRQSLGRIFNGLVSSQLTILRMEEWAGHEQNLRAEPGEWEHFTSCLPPWLWFWAIHRPDLDLAASWRRA